MSPDASQRCAEASAAHGHVFHLEVSEEDAMDLASGYVPVAVQAMAHSMLSWMDQDRRRAERPSAKARTKTKTKTKTKKTHARVDESEHSDGRIYRENHNSG